MTNNDYIAEYIKEKYPTLLGFDFAIWKFGRIMINLAHNLVDVFNEVDMSEVNTPDLDDEEQL